MIYLVTYDLALVPQPPFSFIPPPPHPLYQELQHLKGSRSWWHYLDKTWLLSTEESLQELDKRLRRHLRDTDKLLIVKLGGAYAGLLPSEAWEWIEERMSAGELVK
jgi:hypothetical protein